MYLKMNVGINRATKGNVKVLPIEFELLNLDGNPAFVT